MMQKYEIILYWINEDQVFIAEVPELPGCLAHGNMQEAALTNVKEAIQLWIDRAREFGDTVPEPKGRRLMLAWINKNSVEELEENIKDVYLLMAMDRDF